MVSTGTAAPDDRRARHASSRGSTAPTPPGRAASPAPASPPSSSTAASPRVADLGSRVVQVALPGQDPASLDDGYGHGTFVAGVSAGLSADGKHVGLAPGSTVYAINVSRPDGVRSSDVIAALFWVLQNAKAKNIAVVNLSLSETTPSSYRTSPLDSVVELLWRARRHRRRLGREQRPGHRLVRPRQRSRS